LQRLKDLEEEVGRISVLPGALKERLIEANHKSKLLKASLGKEQIRYMNKRGK